MKKLCASLSAIGMGALLVAAYHATIDDPVSFALARVCPQLSRLDTNPRLTTLQRAALTKFELSCPDGLQRSATSADIVTSAYILSPLL
jgi:hypothetical protein